MQINFAVKIILIFFFIGRPTPSLLWYRDGRHIESNFISDGKDSVQNVLRLKDIQRDSLDVNYTCKAENTNMSHPFQTSVVIDMTRKYFLKSKNVF